MYTPYNTVRVSEAVAYWDDGLPEEGISPEGSPVVMSFGGDFDNGDFDGC